MAVRIDDLEDFGLDEKSLFKLGNRVVEVEVYLDDYEQPYLNDQGYMVRWHLEGITDVWELFDDEFNPKGTEVYSNLRSRRMKPEFEWHPVWKKPRR